MTHFLQINCCIHVYVNKNGLLVKLWTANPSFFSLIGGNMNIFVSGDC